MRFSQKTEYALRAMIELGTRGATAPVPSREIAKAQKIPERFCEQVLADLVARQEELDRSSYLVFQI